MLENDIEIDPLSKDFHHEKYHHFKDFDSEKYPNFKCSIIILETRVH